jgi:acyl-coenzyme A thioesterase PaaI-like protein
LWLAALVVGVLSIEFKINLLRPAQGEHFRFVGKVVKAGRTISVCEGQAFGRTGDAEKLVATMSCTLMTMQGRDDVVG